MAWGTAAGYIGAAVAAVFFGSNYVTTKVAPTGDGVLFGWFMSIGILLVGYLCAAIGGTFIFVPSGLIGGSLWALGNLFVPAAINMVGLGLAFLLWSMGNLLFGFSVGRFGLFGVDKETVSDDALNYVGALLGVLSLFLYFFIRPSIDSSNNPNLRQPESEPLLSKDMEEPEYDIWQVFNTLRPAQRRVAGSVLSVIIGLLYGVTMAPFQSWYNDEEEKGNKPGELDFAFSHYTGIFLFSTFAAFVYFGITRNRPQIHPSSILPAIVSGIMWGIANSAWFVTNANLGLSIGYPIVVLAPGVVSSFWSVVVFKEIRGARNMKFLAAAMALNIACVMCVSFSR